jgi:hypothetical protein
VKTCPAKPVLQSGFQPAPLHTRDALSEIGFSREDADLRALKICRVTTDAFPAEAGPTVRGSARHTGYTRSHNQGFNPPPLDTRDALSGTGFSREEAGMRTLKSAV